MYEPIALAPRQRLDRFCVNKALVLCYVSSLRLLSEWLGCPNRDSSIGTIEPQ